MTFLGAILLTASVLTSCGGSVDGDAKKLAELQCKAQKLDPTNTEEAKTLAEEIAALSTEFKGKYTSESDQKAFDEAYVTEVKNCK
jgi:hypothetical protein